MRKKLKKRIATMGIATVLCMTELVTACAQGVDKKAEDQSIVRQEEDEPNAEGYIVHVEGDSFAKLKEKYGEDSGEEISEYLDDGQNFVADLNQKEIKILNGKEDVIIEPNYIFQASQEDAELLQEEKAILDLADSEWNLDMTNTIDNKTISTLEEDIISRNTSNQIISTEKVRNDAVSPSAVATSAGIRVAVLDSGITYSDDIRYAGAVNFVDPDTDSVGLDMTTHGVGVMGIIAAEDNGIGTRGLAADDMLLYSVKVLDESNETTVGILISAIQWCIKNDIDIINLSLGTDKYVGLLHDVIRQAQEAGILMIASAGNGGYSDRGNVEYPAAYEEVIAVGAVNSDYERSEFSSTGEEIEFVAPGENIPLASLWGGVTEGSGTSFAAPHITAIAAKLWALDPVKPADFIRQLMQKSAGSMGNQKEYGYGLIDYEYALKIYEEFASAYHGKDQGTKDCYQHAADREEYEIPVVLQGRWGRKEEGGVTHYYHDEAVTTWGVQAEGYCLSSAELRLLAASAHASDTVESKEYGKLSDYGVLHARPNKNYVSATKYLYNVAVQVYWDDSKTINSVKDNCNYAKESPDDGEGTKAQGNLIKAVNTARDVSFYQNESLTKKKRALQVLGLALHSAQDTFAHEAQVTWDAIQVLDPPYFTNKAKLDQDINAGRVSTADLGNVYAKDNCKGTVHSIYADGINFFFDRYYTGTAVITKNMLKRFCRNDNFSVFLFHPSGYGRKTYRLRSHVENVYGGLPTSDTVSVASWRDRSFRD